MKHSLSSTIERMTVLKNFKELNEFLQQFVPGSIQDGDFYNPDKMFELLPLLGSPEKKLKVVHIAGTSGKTSTCYYIAEMLRVSGAKVGLTVSPHIFEINERIQINGQPLGEQEMCELFNRFIAIQGFVEQKPTYFELMICFAFWSFAELGCRYAVMEVGLGGLKDATNVIEDPDKVAVITDIGLDHTRILGDTIQLIARQKAGIIRPGNHAFCYTQDEVVDRVIDEAIQKQGAVLHRFVQLELERNVNFVETLPEYQKRNWLLASQVFTHVSERDKLRQLSNEQLLQTQNLAIPARLQRIEHKGKIIVLDGAHNPQKLKMLIKTLQTMYPDKSIALLIAFMESKQTTLQESLELLHGLSDKVIVTEFVASTDLPHKVIPSKELAESCRNAGFETVIQEASQLDAFDNLLNQPEDILLVTGSFYLIGSLKSKIQELSR